VTAPDLTPDQWASLEWFDAHGTNIWRRVVPVDRTTIDSLLAADLIWWRHATNGELVGAGLTDAGREALRQHRQEQP
jgi:hypothetical protein